MSRISQRAGRASLLPPREIWLRWSENAGSIPVGADKEKNAIDLKGVLKMAEAKNNSTGKKPGRPKKTPAAEEIKEETDVFFDVPEEIKTENTTERAEVGEENVLTVNVDEADGANYGVEETHAAPKEETFTKSDVERMIADAVAKAMAGAAVQTAQPQVIQVSNDTEMVHFLWQAPVADDNVVFFGEGGIFGQIVGKSGSFYVPKRDLSRVLTDVNRVYMARRWLMVVSGLNEDEREALGVNYREGELLDKQAFAKMVEIGDRILDIYPKLCDGHKKMVAQRYAEAYAAGSPYVKRETVVKLNEMSKTDKNPRGAFVSVIEDMNERDTL